MNETSRLRNVIERVFNEGELDDLIDRLVAAIIDEFDEEFEKAFMYDTLD